MASHHQPPAVPLDELLGVVKAARALLDGMANRSALDDYLRRERGLLAHALAELDKQP